MKPQNNFLTVVDFRTGIGASSMHGRGRASFLALGSEREGGAPKGAKLTGGGWRGTGPPLTPMDGWGGGEGDRPRPPPPPHPSLRPRTTKRGKQGFLALSHEKGERRRRRVGWCRAGRIFQIGLKGGRIGQTDEGRRRKECARFRGRV